jgi:hypothetical protein
VRQEGAERARRRRNTWQMTWQMTTETEHVADDNREGRNTCPMTTMTTETLKASEQTDTPKKRSERQR